MEDSYRKYGPALLRKAERLLLNKQDAMDIVQGLFMDLWERNQSEFNLPYLYQAVTRRALSMIRDQKNHQRLLARQDIALHPSPRILSESLVIGQDLLTKLIPQLDQKSSEILVYRFIDDMTHDEISVLLGVSKKTVLRKLESIRMLVTKTSEGADD